MSRGAPSVVTVGTYDGVHLGHRRLLAEVLAEGTRLGLRTVVVTFDRHPLEVLRPEAAPKLLTVLEQKLELLAETGVDELEVLHFDLERAHESPEDFVRSYLVGELGAVSILVGSNFHFGHRQAGDAALLAELAARDGFRASGIDLVIDDQTRTVVSSSVIRGHLAAGRLDEATRLLGRHHEVRGEASGSSVAIDPALCLPPPGAYAAVAGRVGGPFVPVSVLVREGEDGAILLVEGEGLAEGAVALRFVEPLGGEGQPASLAARPDADR